MCIFWLIKSEAGRNQKKIKPELIEHPSEFLFVTPSYSKRERIQLKSIPPMKKNNPDTMSWGLIANRSLNGG